MTPDDRKQAFLDIVKSEGRSSPEGIFWHQFYEFLKSRKLRPDNPDPPVPLILAAASESDASKHHRLSSQLQWAIMNNCLDEAVDYLNRIAPENWNRGSLEHWDREYY
jgi:hypothetical protein